MNKSTIVFWSFWILGIFSVLFFNTYIGYLFFFVGLSLSLYLQKKEGRLKSLEEIKEGVKNFAKSIRDIKQEQIITLGKVVGFIVIMLVSTLLVWRILPTLGIEGEITPEHLFSRGVMRLLITVAFCITFLALAFVLSAPYAYEIRYTLYVCIGIFLTFLYIGYYYEKVYEILSKISSEDMVVSGVGIVFLWILILSSKKQRSRRGGWKR